MKDNKWFNPIEEKIDFINKKRTLHSFKMPKIELENVKYLTLIKRRVTIVKNKQ